MGAKSFQLQTVSQLNKEEWQPVPLIPYSDIKDPLYGSNFRLLANKLNMALQIEKYELFFTSYKQYSQYKESISWRNNNRFTVQVKYVSEPQKQNICASFYQGAIYIERIPIRLVEIEDISIQQGLCILNAASQGFQQVYQKFGYFQILPEHVCFTKEGYVKIWVNRNLSKNLPQSLLRQNRAERYDFFIEKLVSIVEKLIDFGGKITIKAFIELSHIQKPYENIHKTLELYAIYAKVKVPRYISKIRNLCQKDDPKRRMSVGAYRFGNCYRNQTLLPAENSKSLEIDKYVVNIAIKPATKDYHSPLTQPNHYSNPQTHHQFYRATGNNVRAPKIRFSYNNSKILSSARVNEKVPNYQERSFLKNSPLSSSTAFQFISLKESYSFMDNKQPRYLSVFENEQLEDITQSFRRYTRF